MKLDGVEVHDATKSCVLHIRKTDAVTGQKDPATCAAAKAACRIEGVIEARIYRSRSYLLVETSGGKTHWIRYTTPASLRSEIVAFDRGGTFDPGEYVLRPACKSMKLGAVFNRKVAHGSTGKKKPRLPPHIARGVRERAPSGRER